jgi:hypothetical protein
MCSVEKTKSTASPAIDITFTLDAGCTVGSRLTTVQFAQKLLTEGDVARPRAMNLNLRIQVPLACV